MLIRNSICASFLCLAIVYSLSQSAQGGVIITEIMYNPSETPESRREWVEIYNAGSTTVDLSGWKLDDEDSSNWGAISGNLDVGQIGVVYNSAFVDDAGFRQAWNLTSDAALFGVSWAGLSNSPSSTNEMLRLLDDGSFVVDAVNYDDANGWPNNDDGASIFLTDLALDNNVGTSWALSMLNAPGVVSPSQTYGASDLGSPGFIPLATTVPEPSSVATFALMGVCVLWRIRRHGLQ